MKHSPLGWSQVAVLCFAAFSGCGVDERPLSYEYRTLGAAGAPIAAGNTGAGAPNAGEAGSTEGNVFSAGGSGTSGTTSDAGSPETQPGEGGTSSAGTPSGGSGVEAAGAEAGAAGGTAGGSAGQSGGSAGSLELPCGDLNRDHVDDCLQNVVQNFGFDSELSGWENEPSSTQTWSPNNASAKSGSGSLQLSNSAAVVEALGSLALGSRQCIAVTPGTSYDFAAQVMLAAGQTGGEAGVNVWLFDDDVCRGNLLTGDTPIHGGAVGTWSVLRGKLWIPDGARSMYLRLVAIKPFVQPSLSVFIDDVLVAKRP